MADYLSRVSHESFVDDEKSHGSICKTSLKQVEEPPARMGIECIKTEQRNHFPELLEAFKTDDAKANAHKRVPDDTIDVKVLDRVSIDSRRLMVLTFNGGRRKKNALFGIKEIKRIVIPPNKETSHGDMSFSRLGWSYGYRADTATCEEFVLLERDER